MSPLCPILPCLRPSSQASLHQSSPIAGFVFLGPKANTNTILPQPQMLSSFAFVHPQLRTSLVAPAGPLDTDHDPTALCDHTLDPGANESPAGPQSSAGPQVN